MKHIEKEINKIKKHKKKPKNQNKRKLKNKTENCVNVNKNQKTINLCVIHFLTIFI